VYFVIVFQARSCFSLSFSSHCFIPFVRAVVVTLLGGARCWYKVVSVYMCEKIGRKVQDEQVDKLE